MTDKEIYEAVEEFLKENLASTPFDKGLPVLQEYVWSLGDKIGKILDFISYRVEYKEGSPKIFEPKTNTREYDTRLGTAFTNTVNPVPIWSNNLSL